MNTLREHLQVYGTTDLSTIDLLALALTPKATPGLLTRLAQLLQAYDARRLRQANSAELQQAGLSKLQAERLVAICELTRRLAMLETPSLPQIRMPRDADSLLRPLMGHLDHETMRVLVLDRQNQVVENIELYRGTVHTTAVVIAEILRPVIVRKCPNLLICHNHPSGNPQPSAQDRQMTEQLVQAAKLFDIELVDHLILGNPRYVSLRTEMGW